FPNVTFLPLDVNFLAEVKKFGSRVNDASSGISRSFDILILKYCVFEAQDVPEVTVILQTIARQGITFHIISPYAASIAVNEIQTQAGQRKCNAIFYKYEKINDVFFRLNDLKVGPNGSSVSNETYGFDRRDYVFFLQVMNKSFIGYPIYFDWMTRGGGGFEEIYFGGRCPSMGPG